MNKNLDLSDLPKKNNFIDWKESKGYLIKGTYDDIYFEFKIKYYDKTSRYLTILYENSEYRIAINNLKKIKLGKILGKFTDDFKYEIGTQFKDNTRDITIIDRKRERDKFGHWWKCYKYKCNKCNFDCGKHYSARDKEYKNEYWVREGSLKLGSNCLCCLESPQIVVKNINSIYKTDPWMIPYIGEGCAKNHTHNSNDKVQVKCPDCGRIKDKKIKIQDLYKSHSINCICNDNIPYGEKLMFNVLEQLDVDFKTQLNKTTFEWCQEYKYDFYFKYNNEEYIIETHGKQHYEKEYGWDELEKTQLNDKIKKELALKNKVKEENYIVIDCRESTLKWIRDNNDGILNSRLAEIFDLSKINWIKTEEFALGNRIKEACELKNNNPNLLTTEIGKLMNMSQSAIYNYLIKGNQLGWCNYISKNEKEINNQNTIKRNKIIRSKQVIIFKNNIMLGIYNSVVDLQNKSEKTYGIRIDQANISAVCRGVRKHTQGFTFKYVQDLTPKERIKYNIDDQLKK